MLADILEPFLLKEALKQRIEVLEVALRNTGLLDYVVSAWDRHLIAIERKEVHDLAGRVNDLELQLKKSIQTVGDSGEVILIREGIMEPIGDSTALYRRTRGGAYYRDRVVSRPFSYYESFLWRLDKLGVSVFTTSCMEATVELLVTIETKSQNPDYSTFRRYIRKKPAIETLNPQVQTLVNLGVGVKRAEALIAAFGSTWNVLIADESEALKVPGVGRKTMEELWEGVARPY